MLCFRDAVVCDEVEEKACIVFGWRCRWKLTLTKRREDNWNEEEGRREEEDDDWWEKDKWEKNPLGVSEGFVKNIKEEREDRWNAHGFMVVPQ